MPESRLRREAAIVLAILSSATAVRTSVEGNPLQSLDFCPRSCLENPWQADWNNFYSIDELRLCAEPMLLTFATFNPIDDPDIQIKIRACTAANTNTSTKALTATSVPEPLYTSESATASGSNDNHIQERQDNRVVDEDDEHPLPQCRTSNSVNTTAQWIAGKPEKISTARGVSAKDSIVGIIRNIQEFLRNPINCDEAVVYGYSQGVLVGLHAGSDIENRELADGFVDRIVDRVLDDSQSDNGLGRSVVQVCGDDRNPNQHLGLAIDSTGDFAWVQGALRSWSEARCVSDVGSQSLVEDDKWPIEIPIIRRESTSPPRVKARRPGISKRAPPTPRPDGTCVSYIVQNQDACSAIAIKYDIKEDDLYTYNEQTYGWGGCALFPGQRICVGPGTPRMPAENPDAECGPTKPGTKAPTGSQKVEDLSPCPLKACCNIWGKCGIDSDFCVPTESLTGNPGTAQPNTNGCVQNCGMELTTGSPPAQFIKVGYYEAWNHQRPCLHMTPQQIPSSYTHIHFSFAEITPSFGVSLGNLGDVFEEFKRLSGFKRIIAFGGWALSTEPATYQLFPNAVKPANRATFAQACVDFVLTHGLDGVDFDWEYPAQPDIPGIPPGDPQEAEDYVEFVKLVREKMPGDKTVSIAAPASYWYLKQFLIAEMSEHLDYIIYMTYDLHGQWDFGSKWSQPGCPAGNCLRSHVNMTETMSSLAMVTKAGVPSAKIIVGVSSYGRSFKMTDASCSGPFCTYTGKESGAAKGKCTGTGGYISNGEINEIIAEGRAKKQWTDDTESDFIVYDDGEWVAYMDDANKQARIAKYRSLNFGGSTDWAVDLQGEPGAYNGEVVYLDPKVYDDTPAQCSPPCLFVFPPSALPSATTIMIPAYTTSIVLQGGSTKTININPPQLTLSSMSFSNVNVTSGSTTGTIHPSGSVDLPRITTVIDGELRTIQLPPWPAITNGPPSNWTRPPTSDEPLIPTTETPEDEDDWKQPEEPKPPFTEVPFDDWPDMELVPVPTPVPDEGEDDDNGKHKSSCRLWFFFVCVAWDDWGINIRGWEFNMPPGLWGPGPPRIDQIRLPLGFTIKGSLPPWPKMTILPGGKPVPPPKPADCTPAEASLCFTTSSFATTVSNSETKTTATQVNSRCATKLVATSATPRPPGPRTAGDAKATIAANSSSLHRRDEPNEPDWKTCQVSNGVQGFIYLSAPLDQKMRDKVLGVLRRREAAFDERDPRLDSRWHEVRVDTEKLKWTSYFYVWNVDETTKQWLRSNSMPGISFTTSPYQEEYGNTAMSRSDNAIPAANDSLAVDMSISEEIDSPAHLEKRAYDRKPTGSWHLSQLSFAEGVTWDQDGTKPEHKPSANEFTYDYDDNFGQGQTIYIIEEGWMPYAPEYLQSRREEPLESNAWGPRFVATSSNVQHGYLVASFAGGKTVGVARKAELVHVPYQLRSEATKERFIEVLTLIANDCAKKPANSCVVNISWGDRVHTISNRDMLARHLMSAMANKLGVVFVLAAGNTGKPTAGWPQTAKNVVGMMVVGGTDKDGVRTSSSSYWADGSVNVWAPGAGLPLPPDGLTEPSMLEGKGTSFAAPQVAGLVAYLRADPSYLANGGKISPEGIKSSILNRYSRKLKLQTPPSGDMRKTIWNGQETCAQPAGPLGRRQADSCPLPGSGGQDVRGPPVEYRSGTPAGPLCSANCGKLCTGYYCVPTPTGTAPDFTPPPTATSCDNPTTVTECVGGPRGGACFTATRCPTSGGGNGGGITGTPTRPVETDFISCTHRGQNPDRPVAHCICDGSTFPVSIETRVTPHESCAYTTKPTRTFNPGEITGGPKTTDTANCRVCSVVNNNNLDCTSLTNCSPQTTDIDNCRVCSVVDHNNLGCTSITNCTPKSTPTPTPKCIVAKVLQQQHPVMRLGSGVDVWVDGVKVCDVSSGSYLITPETAVAEDCEAGGRVYMTNHGLTLEYYDKDGKKHSEWTRDGERWNECCIQKPNGNGCADCRKWEYVYHNGNCDKCPTPELCRRMDCQWDATCRS